MFDDFFNDDTDERQTSDIMEYYHSQVSYFDVMNTCLVLGMITGCLKNDDYEEADIIARMYLGKAEHQCFKEWEAFDNTQTAHERAEYDTDTHAYAVRQLLNVIAYNLQGDDPKIDICVTLCDSFYAELLDSLDEPKIKHVVPNGCEEY
jgi:hypothetical protein